MPIYPYSFQLPPLNVQDIPNDGAVGEFLGISAGGVLDWLPVAGGGGGGDLLAANNLSELTPTASTARTNLGLGTASTPTFANLTLTSPSLTTSAPVTISQTWNAGGVAFTALKVNATSTNSASGSLLLDLQLGGLRRFTVGKDGSLNIGASDVGTAVRLLDFTNQYGNVGFQVGGGGRLDIMNGGSTVSSFFSGGAMTLTGVGSSIGLNSDTILLRDGAANTLALRNGINPQTFNVYGTYTSGSVYERMFARYDGTALAFQVGTQHLGASARPLQLLTDNTARMTIGTTGNVGIGTTAPAASLHINGSSSPPTLRLQQGGSNQVEITMDGNQSLFFNRNNVNQVVFSYLNNVGIGTTAPSSKLHVVGNALFGENVATGGSVINVSFGGSYGIATPGSKANLKWDLYNNGITSDRFGIGMSANLMEFQTGTGAGFGFYPNNSTTSAFSIASNGTATHAGNLIFAPDNTYDIGASGANRPKDIYAGGNGIFAGLVSATNGFRAPGSSQLIASADGVWRLTNSSANDFNRLQFGGTSASFPAIKRSSTTLQARLADDSAFAPIQGKLTTDTAYTAGAITDTGYIVLYDSTGTAYKVACTPV